MSKRMSHYKCQQPRGVEQLEMNRDLKCASTCCSEQQPLFNSSSTDKQLVGDAASSHLPQDASCRICLGGAEVLFAKLNPSTQEMDCYYQGSTCRV